MRRNVLACFTCLALAVSFSAPATGLAAPAPKATKAVKATKPVKPAPSVAAPVVSPVERQMVSWIVSTTDHRALPFVIVDKQAATVSVYSGSGELRGVSPALLGFAVGDDSVPGIGDREMSDILPEERTTPAGRFVARYGPSADGERVLWVDYATAISLHPVATGVPSERRLERIKSSTVDDNRITFGCINVPKAFYDKVVRKTITSQGAVFYVLPEEKPLRDVFPGTVFASLASAER